MNKQRAIKLLLFISMLLIYIGINTASAYASTTMIYTATDLSNIRNNLSGSYQLANDIDLTGINWVPIGTSTKPFTGTLNGEFHTISNLTMDTSTDGYADAADVGLFSSSKGAGAYTRNVICNVTITVKSINSTLRNVGTLVGSTTYTDITCVGVQEASGSTDLVATGESTGGIVGSFVDGTISKVYSAINVTGDIDTGGIAGSAEENQDNLSGINNVYACGTVTGTCYVGGLVGNTSTYMSYGTWTVVSNSYFAGTYVERETH